MSSLRPNSMKAWLVYNYKKGKCNSARIMDIILLLPMQILSIYHEGDFEWKKPGYLTPDCFACISSATRGNATFPVRRVSSLGQNRVLQYLFRIIFDVVAFEFDKLIKPESAQRLTFSRILPSGPSKVLPPVSHVNKARLMTYGTREITSVDETSTDFYIFS